MPLTVHQLAAELSQGLEARHRLGLALADCSLAVESNSPELIAELAAYFRAFVPKGAGDDSGRAAELTVTALETERPDIDLELRIKQPDPGKTKIKEEFFDLADGRLVRKRLTGMVFVFGPGRHLALGPCLANSNQVINFVNNRFIQRELESGSLLAHAAAVAAPGPDGRGLALAGFSGMGKSTLALWLVSRGLDFISNDRLLVRRADGAAAMSGVAKQPRINPGTALANPDLAALVPAADRKRFSRLAPDELWTLEHKYDAIIDDIFGPGRFRSAAPLNGLAILNWRRQAGPIQVNRVDLRARRDLLAAFKKEPGLFYLPGRPVEDFTDELYLEALAGVEVFEISGGVDFDAAADHLARYLRGADV